MTNDALREALERVFKIAQRKDMGAPAKVACIESVAHEALSAPVVSEPTEAIIHLSWREDGGLRVTSPTHRGLVLSHSRADLVMLDILPALEVMGFDRLAKRNADTESRNP